MRSFLSLGLVAVFASAALSAPAELFARQDTAEHCGQWDSVDLDDYILYVNQWGKDNADSGEACAQVVSVRADTVAWTTTWTWTGGDGVKSYTNINAKNGINTQLSALSRIAATWTWSQSTSGHVVANIAYDLFTSSTSGGSNEYEIMIWLDNINAGPISYTYSAEGNPTPIASGLSLAGFTWDLYYGSNGANQVYSFLTSDSSTINTFNGDLIVFFDYLTTEQTLSPSQYLTTAQGGTEATEGSATLDTSAFSLVPS